MTLNQVLEKIPDDVDGVTISGGEPFLQARSLLALVTFIKATRRLPIIVFSGFYCDEIEKMKIGRKVLEKIDALIDGRFEEQLLSLNQLRGSANQTIHLFTDVYRLKDFEKREAEVIVSPEGEMFITGFPSKGILEELNLN
jgi:anaerobic ribonucleoside-triphosphate reductase activating protein